MQIIVVTGGAYQGKLEYVLENYAPSLDDVFDCKHQTEIDFSKRVIYNFQDYVRYMVENNIEHYYIMENIDCFFNKIIIADDISSGIVPMDKVERIWREETGRALNFLCKNADRVIRVFCGIGTVIK